MSPKIRIICLALWKYLNQPLFVSSPKAMWKIRIFWYYYQIDFLERCLLKNTTSKSKDIRS